MRMLVATSIGIGIVNDIATVTNAVDTVTGTGTIMSIGIASGHASIGAAFALSLRLVLHYQYY